MTSDLSHRINERLARLSQTVKPSTKTSSLCALKNSCPHCLGHKGVLLFEHCGLTQAKLCKCVEQCAKCSGSCFLAQGNTVEHCVNPSPKKVIGLINDARIPAKYIHADIQKFEGFNPADKSERSTLSNWLQTLVPGKSSGLLLSGPIGLGKSWFLAAVAKHLAFQGVSVRYADFFQLVHELRDAYSSENSDKSSLRPLQMADVLIIDELGKGRNSEWELSVADSLISERYNSNKCVIAATNYTVKEKTPDTAQKQLDYLKNDQSTANQMNSNHFESLNVRIGSRMFSRLTENCVCIEISGRDRRLN